MPMTVTNREFSNWKKKHKKINDKRVMLFDQEKQAQSKYHMINKINLNKR
jgi:hypothetical protein